jgi:oxygen-independent coproporphyrinogen-3 oxidase
MAGIYIHVPFCKQRCNYCNFHFSTNTQRVDDFLHAAKKELILRKEYLALQNLETIYIGGGTPSLLSISQLSELKHTIDKHYNINHIKEFTIEVNPDDVNKDYYHALKTMGINRLSIGIQSFKETDLSFMQRAHNIKQSYLAIEHAIATGFNNISIDLIYGTPNLSDEEWIKNIQQALSYGITHISAYALTVEPNTLLEHQIKHHKRQPLHEHQAAQQFEILVEKLEEAGFEQYEISNFAKHPHYALHNTNYWKGKHYLGIGPSAHSYNGSSRQWNIANNALYIKNILDRNEVLFEIEQLTEENKWNEYMMTALRTQWGADIEILNTEFPLKFWESIQTELNKTITNGHMVIYNHHLVLTKSGKLLADGIASRMFV